MINESFAHLTCACGQKFQVLNEHEDDWDEQATFEAYYNHECPLNKE